MIFEKKKEWSLTLTCIGSRSSKQAEVELHWYVGAVYYKHLHWIELLEITTIRQLKFESEYENVIRRKCIWKIFMQNFVQGLIG